MYCSSCSNAENQIIFGTVCRIFPLRPLCHFSLLISSLLPSNIPSSLLYFPSSSALSSLIYPILFSSSFPLLLLLPSSAPHSPPPYLPSIPPCSFRSLSKIYSLYTLYYWMYNVHCKYPLFPPRLSLHHHKCPMPVT